MEFIRGVQGVFSFPLELCGGTVFRYNACMDSGGSKKRMRIVFSGRVQGVGFRYAVCRIAETFAVVGHVHNLPDGTVEVVTEGVEQELVDFLHGIKGARIGRYVAKEQVAWRPATNEFDEFRILF